MMRSLVLAALVLAVPGSAAQALTWGPFERYVYAHADVWPYTPWPGQTEVPVQSPQTVEFSTGEAGLFNAQAIASREVLYDPEWGESASSTWSNRASISQSSTIGANTVASYSEGRVRGTGDIGAPLAEGDSYLSITFTTDHAMNYAIAGSYELYGWSFLASAGVSLVGSSGTIFDFPVANYDDGSMLAGGSLPADTYTLVAFLSLRCGCEEFGMTEADEGFLEFTFSLTAIPEPSTALLLGVGLLALARRR